MATCNACCVCAFHLTDFGSPKMDGLQSRCAVVCRCFFLGCPWMCCYRGARSSRGVVCRKPEKASKTTTNQPWPAESAESADTALRRSVCVTHNMPLCVQGVTCHCGLPAPLISTNICKRLIPEKISNKKISSRPCRALPLMDHARVVFCGCEPPPPPPIVAAAAAPPYALSQSPQRIMVWCR